MDETRTYPLLRRALEMLRRFRFTPGRMLVFGFAGVILLGTALLMLPAAHNPGVEIGLLDAFFTATSATCVTGLIVVDTGDAFSVFGRTVIAALIQIGGLGVASFSVFFIIMAGRKVGLRERLLVKEALNLDSLKGVVRLIKAIVLLTLCFEAAGAALSYVTFSRDYPPLTALGISVFHSIASFNNAGFDILGGYRSLVGYQGDVLLNLTTCLLIIFGGLGFGVMLDIWRKRSLRGLSVNTKIVLLVTGVLILGGTLLLKATDNITWLGALFQSVSARTAGFASYPMGGLSNAGLLVLIMLMFIGASPGSTGGGIKTTTFYTLLKSVTSLATNRSCTAFRRKIPSESIMKAIVIVLLALGLVALNTLAICMLEPQLTFMEVLFETVSAFGTVGLSTGITPELCWASKLILALTMFCGRLGPVTMACIWHYQPPSGLSYAEERVTIG